MSDKYEDILVGPMTDFDAAKRVELCHHGRKIACPECVDEDPAVEYMLRGEVIGLRFKVREQAEEIEQLKERLVRLQDLHRDEHLRAEKAEAEVVRLRSLLEANIPPRTYGSLQEEVDFLRRDVASLQANKHNLITRLAAERERSERLKKVLESIESEMRGKSYMRETAREALSAAASDPTPSEECCNRKPSAPHTHGVGSEQQYLPLGHEFVAGHPHPAYQSYCALRGIFGLCGQPESAHRRKP